MTCGHRRETGRFGPGPALNSGKGLAKNASGSYQMAVALILRRRLWLSEPQWPQHRLLVGDTYKRCFHYPDYKYMLTIRKEQMDALGAATRIKFEKRALAHLYKNLPDRCRELGDATVRASVATALEKGKQYRLRSELDHIRYLNLMYTLGFDFDTDDNYPWAAQALNDPVIDSPEKMSYLVEQAKAVLREKADV